MNNEYSFIIWFNDMKFSSMSLRICTVYYFVGFGLFYRLMFFSIRNLKNNNDCEA